MEVYENAMVEARVAFADRVNPLIKSATADSLGFFLIYYSALGLALHETMDKLLRKAVKRSQKLGYADLSKALQTQADLELEYCQHRKQDLREWVEWWNGKRGLNLSVKDYLKHPTMPSMQNFVDLHKDVVKHRSVFAELAMVYEMQRANSIYSFSLIKLAIFKLGMSSLKPLGFIRRMTKDDSQGPLNKQMLSDFLKMHSDALPVMLDKANAMLSVYSDFLEDCFTLSTNDAKKYQLKETAEMK